MLVCNSVSSCMKSQWVHNNLYGIKLNTVSLYCCCCCIEQYSIRILCSISHSFTRHQYQMPISLWLCVYLLCLPIDVCPISMCCYSCTQPVYQFCYSHTHTHTQFINAKWWFRMVATAFSSQTFSLSLSMYSDSLIHYDGDEALFREKNPETVLLCHLFISFIRLRYSCSIALHFHTDPFDRL